MHLSLSTGLETLNIANLKKLAAKAETCKVQVSVCSVNFYLGEIFTNFVYPLLPETLNWRVWERFWMIHSSSGLHGHAQLLTAALPVGIWSIIVTGGKPDPYFRGKGGWVCSLCEEMEAGIWSKSAPGQQLSGNCMSKFPEKPFIYWPRPVWQCPCSLLWNLTRCPHKVHSSPRHSNIARFPVETWAQGY